MSPMRVAGIYALAKGTVLGYAAQLILLAIGLRSENVSIGGSFREDLGAMKHQAHTLMVGTALMGSTELVDQTMAAMLDTGSVAALGHGTKIVTVLLGLGAGTIGTAAFPHLSTMVAVGDWSGVRHTLKRYTQLILAASVPVTIVLVVGSTWIVATVFERGAFTASDTQTVARVQALYALQIPFYVLGILGVRVLSSMTLNRVVMLIAGVNVVTNVVGKLLADEAVRGGGNRALYLDRVLPVVRAHHGSAPRPPPNPLKHDSRLDMLRYVASSL